LPYTHEFLSHMLGANRKSVTLAAQSLQTAGLISYRRGKILVVDRAGVGPEPSPFGSLFRGDRR
jgi:CRP-like cAMP-binding protein